MKMKPLFLLLLVLITMGATAQGSDAKRDKIKALKTSLLTTKLELTSTEAEKFWPVYNAFEEKQYDIRHKKMHSLIDKLKDGSAEKMNEKEAAVFLSQLQSAEDDLYQNRKKLVTNLKNIISPIKIIKLKKAEEDFNRTLLKEYRGKKE
ncbi:sensor of ECF-type sigma factor [Flavobacterium kingsejongi]|uniref:Sensor of ECF-type sigma factor n=1 Tax=Flavobacterium kingsejongi TaxID=1678728 RepID=A0A2S1LS98_9FLAO|nr:sensor of ECF-type sigma factor [Flavobacterium kingsejongi]AWG26637.1 sensor of ECF-type sigma factor [Flavobacterium kingsejongi]